jgi:hypothetical protein
MLAPPGGRQGGGKRDGITGFNVFAGCAELPIPEDYRIY